MDDLVKKLSTGKHAVDFEPRTEEIKEIKERLEMGFVFVKFTDTRGETELGIDVDKNNTNLKGADFEKGKGNIHVEGTCELNYHKVRCISEVDLKTRKGKAWLEIIDESEMIDSSIH